VEQKIQLMEPAEKMLKNSEEIFYLIDHAGIRRVPVKIMSRNGRYGYAIHPKGKGNDASAAEYTADEQRMVQAVVLEGLGVRCRASGGDRDGQTNTLGLSGKSIRGYWLAPECQHWVKGVLHATPDGVDELPDSIVRLEKSEKQATTGVSAPTDLPSTTTAVQNTYRNREGFRFADHCCQGGERVLSTGDFALDDLTIAKEGSRRLRFSPLGNRPVNPRIALVGITPGGQIEHFASSLSEMDVASAAHKAAFKGAHLPIKTLLKAHGLASHIGINLDCDLNDNPDILTTSIVKCCLMVDDGYRFSAPDIAASAAAAHCATKRFVDELFAYPTLKWVFVFGEPGWVALHELRRDGKALIDVLRSGGLKVLQLPHFAQNFQQRELFCCSPSEEDGLLKAKPEYVKYSAAALRMRDTVIRAIS
jgi:hypothetical protein